MNIFKWYWIYPHLILVDPRGARQAKWLLNWHLEFWFGAAEKIRQIIKETPWKSCLDIFAI
jgi:hypothetical protein